MDCVGHVQKQLTKAVNSFISLCPSKGKKSNIPFALLDQILGANSSKIRPWERQYTKEMIACLGSF